MSILVNFSGATLRKPGAYSRVQVAQGGASAAQLGVVAIMGEAEEGDPFSAESGLSSVSWTPDQFASIRAKYGSGPLVDAARLAFNPSNDPQIVGGAQLLLTMKTNQSVKASLTVPTSYGTAKAKKAGVPGNNLALTITTSGSQRVLTIDDAVSGTSEISSLIGGTTVMTIQITGGGVSAATLSISATTFTTTVTGGSAPSLSLPLSQFSSVGQLVDYLSAQTGYTATAGTASQRQRPLSVLDRVSAVDVFTAPYAVKSDAADIRAFFAESAFVDFTPTLFVGLPVNLSKTFFSGGLKGATTNANVQDTTDALLKTRINFVVPLFSRDASADISDALTDSGSSYTIDSLHAMLRSHVAQASTIRGRKERQGWASFKGSYSDTKLKSSTIGSSRVSLCFQDINIQDASGSLVSAQPHMLSVLAAGMKASAVVGLPNTFKLIQASGVSHSTFDPETQADDAIDANLTFAERAPGGGFRFVLDNSTYAQSVNAWIFNRPAVLYAADTAAFTIRFNLEQFVGRRTSDVSVETIKNFLSTVLDSIRASGILVPTAGNGGRGYSDLTVQLDGNIVRTSVTMTMAEGLDFILSDLTVTRASA